MSAPAQKVALVTGSAQGIGLAAAERLSAAGHYVIGVDLLAQQSGPCDRVVVLDLADAAACEHLIADVQADHEVDVLVNNAGVLMRRTIDEVEVSDIDRTFAVNFRAPFLLSRGLVGGMQARGRGRIINVASIGARTGGLAANSIYAASKAALVALTKNFARAYAQYGITVNALAPGGVDTPMSKGNTPEVRARIVGEIPAGRLASPDEAGSVIAFLASDDASWVNGVTLDVNGGWLMA